MWELTFAKRLLKRLIGDDRLRVGWLNSWDLSGRGTTRAEDAQGTPTQSHISPSILVYEDKVVPAAGVDAVMVTPTGLGFISRV